jgi:hypothetical protein
MSLVGSALQRVRLTRLVNEIAKSLIARTFCGSRARARSNNPTASFKLSMLRFELNIVSPCITRSPASGFSGRSRIARRLSALTSSNPSDVASPATNSTCNLPSVRRSPSNRSAHTCAPVSVENKLGVDRDLVADPAHAAFEQIADAEFQANLLRVHALAFVGEGRVPSDDEAVGQMRKIGRQIVGDSVSKKLLLRIAAQILERENDDRKPRGEGQLLVNGRGHEAWRVPARHA